MPTALEIDQHREVQNAAKSVLARLGQLITANDTEKSITEKAQHLLAEHGYTETWYYNCPAFVLFGFSSCVYVSGKDYAPREERVCGSNPVTIDFSPGKG